jgi:hypothetical protein
MNPGSFFQRKKIRIRPCEVKGKSESHFERSLNQCLRQFQTSTSTGFKRNA